MEKHNEGKKGLLFSPGCVLASKSWIPDTGVVPVFSWECGPGLEQVCWSGSMDQSVGVHTRSLVII
jgi:hypothetical protein